jgi:hypothetical protein
MTKKKNFLKLIILAKANPNYIFRTKAIKDSAMINNVLVKLIQLILQNKF